MHDLLLFCHKIAHKTGKCSAWLLCPISKPLIMYRCPARLFCPSKKHHGALSCSSFLSVLKAAVLPSCSVRLPLSLLKKLHKAYIYLHELSAVSQNVFTQHACPDCLFCRPKLQTHIRWSGIFSVSKIITHGSCSVQLPFSLLKNTRKQTHVCAALLLYLKSNSSAPMSAWLVLLSKSGAGSSMAWLLSVSITTSAEPCLSGCFVSLKIQQALLLYAWLFCLLSKLPWPRPMSAWPVLLLKVTGKSTDGPASSVFCPKFEPIAFMFYAATLSQLARNTKLTRSCLCGFFCFFKMLRGTVECVLCLSKGIYILYLDLTITFLCTLFLSEIVTNRCHVLRGCVVPACSKF
jgi:hypothetical protein